MSLPDNVESRKQKLGKQKWKGVHPPQSTALSFSRRAYCYGGRVHLLSAFCFLLSIFCSAADDSSGSPREIDSPGSASTRRVLISQGEPREITPSPPGPVMSAGISRGKPELFLPRKFEAALKNGEIVGREQVRRVFVTSGTNEFVFVVPQGLPGEILRVVMTGGEGVISPGERMDAHPDKVTLVSADSSYFLTFRILSEEVISRGKVAESNTANPASGPSSAQRDFCRRYVLELFPGAQILEEFSKTAASRNGPAFEMRSQAEGGMERALCVALVPSEAGVLEFTLNADLSKSADAKAAFHSLLRTFRSNSPREMETRSDRIPRGDYLPGTS